MLSRDEQFCQYGVCKSNKIAAVVNSKSDVDTDGSSSSVATGAVVCGVIVSMVAILAAVVLRSRRQGPLLTDYASEI